MKYSFPEIKRIEEVLTAIAGREEFIVLEKDDYTVIDYIMQSPTTFPYVDLSAIRDDYKDRAKVAAILRECRGIIFDNNGDILSRPFHKFFNYGEKPDEQVGCGVPEHMLEKLDGSMIRPLIIDGGVRLATRKGITDVAMQAEVFIADKEEYTNLITAYYFSGYTPIFEWCSRKNQIVIDYPEDALILLTIRHNISGEYIAYEAVKGIAEKFGVPYVESFTVDTFDSAKGLTDKEGYVFIFPDGHRVKAKADWYILLHKAKEAIGREKDLIKLYLTTGVDDILPILPEKYKEEVCHFLAKLTEQLVATCQRLDGIFVNIINKLPDEFTRKQFALEVIKLDPKYKSIMFHLLSGISCMEVVIPYLVKACHSKKSLDEWRWLISNIRFGDKAGETA